MNIKINALGNANIFVLFFMQIIVFNNLKICIIFFIFVRRTFVYYLLVQP